MCRKHDRDRKFIKVFKNNGEIALKLHQVCEIVIDESGDSNPGAVICENCLRNLKNALAFKIKALKSDRYFKHLCKVYPTPLLVEMVTCEIKQEPLELDAVEKSNPPIFKMNPNIDFIVSHNDSDSNDFDNNDAYFGDPMDTEETEERDRQKETEKLIEPDEAKDRIRKTSRYKREPSKDIEPIKAGDETHYNRVPDGFSCAFCNKTYKALHSFRSHFRFVHQKADQTMCQKCGKICASEGHLRLHMKTCGRSIKYECDVCGKVFINRSRIILHLKMVHFSTPCICHHCGKSFGNERYLAIHSQIHDYKEKNIKPFACKFCEKRFHSYQGWKLHERNSHRGGAAAPLPEMFLDDNEDGKSSMVNCKRCPSSFNTKRELTEHIAIDHPEVMPVGETCQICNKTFTSSYCLSQHVSTFIDYPDKIFLMLFHDRFEESMTRPPTFNATFVKSNWQQDKVSVIISTYISNS